MIAFSRPSIRHIYNDRRGIVSRFDHLRIVSHVTVTVCTSLLNIKTCTVHACTSSQPGTSVSSTEWQQLLSSPFTHTSQDLITQPVKPNEQKPGEILPSRRCIFPFSVIVAMHLAAGATCVGHVLVTRVHMHKSLLRPEWNHD